MTVTSSLIAAHIYKRPFSWLPGQRIPSRVLDKIARRLARHGLLPSENY